MNYPFAVRRAVPADREAVLTLARAVDPNDWLTYAYDDFMAEQEPAGLYVAEQEGQLIGCYHMELPAPTEAYFSAMRIHPSVQGRGFGSLFCRAQVEQARSVVSGHIYLLSKPDNLPAHRTVEKNGFENRGLWSIWSDLPVAGLNAMPQRARHAGPADMPAVRRFLAERSGEPLRDVICGPTSAWAVATMREADWEPANLAVVEGPAGLDGLMLLGLDREWLVVRRLEGSPEAAADLLAFAAAEAPRRGCTKLDIGLPARCEPLLAPLGLDPAKVHHMSVFRMPAGRELR